MECRWTLVGESDVESRWPLFDELDLLPPIVVVVLRAQVSFEGRYHAFISPIAVGCPIETGVSASPPHINVGRVGREIVILLRMNGEAMARLEPRLGCFDAGSGRQIGGGFRRLFVVRTSSNRPQKRLPRSVPP